MDANTFIVKNAPAKICYIPNFITVEEERNLLDKVYSVPKPKWQNLSNRRLQQWGGIVGKKSLISDGMLPDWLAGYITRICNVVGTFPENSRPNHVLINEYLPGQGIMPHTDGSAFFPLVSTISLGSHTLLKFYEHNEAANTDGCGRVALGSMLLQPRSLILISDNAYAKYLHGIDEVDVDDIDDCVFNRLENMDLGTRLHRSTRISLTIRNVPKVNTSLFRKTFK